MTGNVEAESLRVMLQEKMRESEAQEATIARLVADVQRLQRDSRDLAELLEAIRRRIGCEHEGCGRIATVWAAGDNEGNYCDEHDVDAPMKIEHPWAAVVRRRQEEPDRSVKLERDDG